MRVLPLQLLTWGTATAAISSAVWLSSTDQGDLLCSISYHATSPAIGLDLPLPDAPTRAGSPPTPSSHAAKGSS